MKIIFLIFFSLFLTQTMGAQEKKWIERLEYIGVAIKEKGYHIWGCSPILGPDGKIHLFVARWPEEAKHYPGWHSACEIAHYIGDNPEGPFVFNSVALKGTGKNTWDKYAPHNPLIKKVGDTYALFYIANRIGADRGFVPTQRIGLATSKSLYGPWKKVGKDGLILSPSENPNHWTYNAFNGVNNPAFIEKDGTFFLYFKSTGRKMGLAVADKLEGPYVKLPFPVTRTDKEIEDGYAFEMDGRIHLLTTDNGGTIKKGGGILWSSENGVDFNQLEPGFDRMEAYLPEELLKNAIDPKTPNDPAHNSWKFERPQILLINGKPSYLYMPSGTNILSKEGLGNVTVSYVFRINQ